MKKIITIVIIVLLALGFGFFLFKISPQNTSTTSVGYNAALNIGPQDPISQPPVFDPVTDHYMGNPAAKNVFIEYGDMQCPSCAMNAPILKQISSVFEDTVFVYRHFPLVSAHQNAVIGSMAVEAAGAQGKFWEMQEALFTKQVEWQFLGDPIEKFVGYAQSVNVGNLEQFRNDLVEKKYLAKIQKESDQAYALNLQGTPSLFFNNHVLETRGDINSLRLQAEQYFVK